MTNTDKLFLYTSALKQAAVGKFIQRMIKKPSVGPFVDATGAGAAYKAQAPITKSVFERDGHPSLNMLSMHIKNDPSTPALLSVAETHIPPHLVGTQATYAALFGAAPKLHHKMGLGRKMYGGVIRKAYTGFKQDGGPRFFTSDAEGYTSESAHHLWNSLKRRGYPVAEGVSVAGKTPAYSIDLSNMQKFYKDKPIAGVTKEAMMRREMLSALINAPSLLTAGGLAAFGKGVGKEQVSLLSAAPIRQVTGVDMVPLLFKAKSNNQLLDRIQNNTALSRRRFIKDTTTDTMLKHTPAGMAMNSLAPKAPGLISTMLQAVGNLAL